MTPARRKTDRDDKRVEQGSVVLRIAAIVALCFMFYLDKGTGEKISEFYYLAMFALAAGSTKFVSRVFGGK